jgi:hypothetical protein
MTVDQSEEEIIQLQNSAEADILNRWLTGLFLELINILTSRMVYRTQFIMVKEL